MCIRDRFWLSWERNKAVTLPQAGPSACGRIGRGERGRHMYKKDKYLGYCFIAPWLLGFLVLTLYPFVVSFVYSFTDYDMFKMQFAGLQNYIDIFTKDKIFMGSLGKTLLYTAVSVPLKLLVALLVAMMLNKLKRGRAVYYTIFYLPSILGSSVALAVLWKYVFKKDGLLNLLLGAVGISGANWLGDPNLVLYVMMLLPLWQMGAPMVLFLAALKNVPVDLTEAARIDGARPFQAVSYTHLDVYKRQPWRGYLLPEGQTPPDWQPDVRLFRKRIFSFCNFP